MKAIRANPLYSAHKLLQGGPADRGIINHLNLHSGMAAIVRFIDYIIGRIEGRYQPSNPLLFRRKNNHIHIKNNSSSLDHCKNTKTVNEDSPRFTVMPDKTKESSQSITRGNFKFGYKQDPLD